LWICCQILQVVGHLLFRVGLAVEVAEQLGAVRLGREEVVEIEPELLDEMLELNVAVVDQLAAVLVDLAVYEVTSARPAAPARAPASRRSLRLVKLASASSSATSTAVRSSLLTSGVRAIVSPCSTRCY